MKRFQIGVRHLCIAILLTSIVSSFVALHFQRVHLKKREQTVLARSQRVDSADWQFKTLRGLSMESDRQRKAIQTLLTYWDELKFRNGGSRPKINGRELNTMIFCNSGRVDGATVTVLVLMDWDQNRAIDALSFVSDPKTEQHTCSERTGEQYQIELTTYPPNDYMSVRTKLIWTLSSSGQFEQQIADVTK